MTAPIITIKDLHKVFPAKEGGRRVEVLKEVDLTVHKGEFLVLLGPSGCGKSTLLRIISGLETHTSGKITYGKTFNANSVSFVFQNFGILPWLTVFQNVELNLIGQEVPPDIRIRMVEKILAVFELLVFKHRFPHDLSGGMKQRVGLARAFVSKPSVIFLDEPFSELDFFTATGLRNVLLELWEKQKTTVVMVSHYVDEAVVLADRIAIFSDRPAKVIEVVTNILPRPRNPRSSEFFALEDAVLEQLGKSRG